MRLLVRIDGTDGGGIRFDLHLTCVIWVVIGVITVLRDHLDPLNHLHAAILAVQQASLQDDILTIISLELHNTFILSIAFHCGFWSISNLMRTVPVLLTATLISALNWKLFTIVALYPDIWKAHIFDSLTVVLWRREVTTTMLLVFR